MRKKILITGGAGFIGSHLTDRLLKEGHHVTVIDNLINGKLSNLHEAQQSKNFKFIQGDILDPFENVNATKDIDVVYHLACLGVRHSIHSPFENHRVNAEGTLNVLEASKINNVKKFFYISSSEVYGAVKHFPITETELPEPLTVYGASKLVGEYYTKIYDECYGLDTTTFRIFNNYGPRAYYEGDAGEIIPRTIVHLLYDEKPVLFGDGLATRDFFFVKDTALALSNMMKYSSIRSETINIGTGKEYTMKEMITKIIRVMNKENIKIKYLESRPADVSRLLVNAAKFYALTDFKAQYSLDKGLSETIDYYKNLSQEKNLLSEIDEKNWVGKSK